MNIIYFSILFLILFQNCLSDYVRCKVSCKDNFGFPTEKDDVICGKAIFKQNECIVNKYLGCLIVEMKIEKLDGVCIERITKTCGYNEPLASQYTGSYNEIRNAKEGKEIITKTRCFSDYCNI